jgi:hypothetical protein
MRPHQKLDLWRRAIEFVVSVYRTTERFPKEEKFGFNFPGTTGRGFNRG